MIHNGAYISDNNSYSLVKKYDEEGPRGLIKKQEKDTDSLRYGSLLDDYLFLDKFEFSDKYLITSLKLPPALKQIAAAVTKEFEIEEIDDIANSEEDKDKVVAIIKDLGLFGNIKKTETFITKFNNKQFYDYCKEIYTDKIVIPIGEFVEMKEAAASLKTNKKTKEYFDNSFENIYQLELKWKYRGTMMRCFLDMVMIDHENKVIKGVDLKTGSMGAEDFMSNFFKFKYYLQAGIYTLALEEYNKERFNGEYTVDSFKFMYLPKFDILNPLIYNTSDKWIEASIKGFKTISGYTYKGLEQLVDEITWHRKEKVFNLSKEAFLEKEVSLKDDFIKLAD